MKSPLRRTLTLALVGGAGYAGWVWWARREPAIEAAAPEWPPINPPGEAPSTEPDPPTAAASQPAPTATPNAPSTDSSVPAAAPEHSASGSAAQPLLGGGDRAWVEPAEDGSCPTDFPIKANDNSGIFHVPGGRFYDRTGPERCYRNPVDAIADGYRQAKS